MLQIEDEARSWSRLEHAKAGYAMSNRINRIAGHAASTAKKDDAQGVGLPVHLRMGAEFGLEREQQQSLLEWQMEARAHQQAVAEAAARREGLTWLGSKVGWSGRSPSVPALLTALRARRPAPTF